MKVTQEQFLKKCKQKHGDRYDYSKTIYMGVKAKVEIICPEHGSFWIRADGHNEGRGCPKCSLRSTTEEFIEKAQTIHDDKYDYSKTIYVNATAKVEIVCIKHNSSFWQSATSHLRGSACPMCGLEKMKDSPCMPKEEFIKKANIVHNNFYDYSKMKYSRASDKLLICCPNHGEFYQRGRSHLEGYGCYGCGIETKILTQEKFIERANIVHDNFYDYSLVEYKHGRIKVIIKCPKHGSFLQIPNSHLSGKGCQRCSRHISIPEVIWLNYLGLPNDSNHRNVTFTINGKRYRVDGFDPETNTIYEFNGDYYHGNPKIFPPNGINHKSKKTFAELNEATLNKEKAFTEAGYKVVSIWENDFKRMCKEVGMPLKKVR